MTSFIDSPSDIDQKCKVWPQNFFSFFPEGPTAEVFELHLVADNTTVTQVKKATGDLDKMLFLENVALAHIFYRHDFITQVHESIFNQSLSKLINSHLFSSELYSEYYSFHLFD